MPTALRKYWENLPTPVASALAHAASLAVGLMAAFMLHYVLYRIGLPSKPFIYVAF